MFHEQITVLELPRDAAAEQPLKALAEACEVATFGALEEGKGKNVTDPSYRKALKLEPTAFGSNLNLVRLLVPVLSTSGSPRSTSEHAVLTRRPSLASWRTSRSCWRQTRAP